MWVKTGQEDSRGGGQRQDKKIVEDVAKRQDKKMVYEVGKDRTEDGRRCGKRQDK